MTYSIAIQSLSSIVTNSSSALFTIKTDNTVEVIRDLIYAKVEELGYSQSDYDSDTYFPEISPSADEGYIDVDWLILCNLDDPDKLLEDLFGKENVKLQWDH